VALTGFPLNFLLFSFDHLRIKERFSFHCSHPLHEEYAMLLSNTEEIPGKSIVAFHGIVSGNTVRAKHAGRDIMASMKNIVGGELKGYTELLQESREEALKRMQAQASQLGANAVINIRFSTSSVAAGASELYVYGTAVTVG
jgi:uncharacterized protein YbjQ (UPF0145 family)